MEIQNLAPHWIDYFSSDRGLSKKELTDTRCLSILLAALGTGFVVGSGFAFKAAAEIKGGDRIPIAEVGLLSLSLGLIAYGAAARELWNKKTEDVESVVAYEDEMEHTTTSDALNISFTDSDTLDSHTLNSETPEEISPKDF